ncbi:class I SAM-dependent methyltransferase [Fimbriimonas ginsengisoli]|uniref:Methyltransferase-like protein n=1 Tax=Fimbriimonas ginsengisoli Gsoil 348 TaxID=661478 RepID=A0A068NRT8_FIMGI|nr:class I SAM-dependent methyltransferase [Fimbriimonas ginsengisoli]AIE86268.1 methyltransferase-like protein [Fimbriimonas ginsengisoli Gsoil 348]
MNRLSTAEGRRAFGDDPASYDVARPDYPARVYEVLAERCGLRPGARVFEVGAGTGLATRRLLEAGAEVVAVEPDERMASHLSSSVSNPRLRIVTAPFEDAEIAAPFDLGVAATSFHWLDESLALRKIARLLRPGGYWAMWWHVFGEPRHTNRFHTATDSIMMPLASSPSEGTDGRPAFARDTELRLAALERNGEFEEICYEEVAWVARLDSVAVRRLYGTFSPVTRLPLEDRTRVLDGIERVARDEFGGLVEFPIVLSMYTARRR